MDDNAEAGIARVQARAAQVEMEQSSGLQKRHKWGVAYLDERIIIYLFGLAFLILIGIWSTNSSNILKFGALGLVFVSMVAWGFIRIKGIHKLREQREQQVEELRNGSDK